MESKECIRKIIEKYNIGQKPLSKVLGWGESTISRYLQNDDPIEKYKNILQEVFDDPLLFKSFLLKNKNLISDVAFKKSLLAVEKEINNKNKDKGVCVDGYVRVSAHTIKIEVANVEENKNKIIDAILNCDKDVSLLSFNELTLTGYTCNDLFLQSLLIDKVEDALFDIARVSLDKNTLYIIGAPIRFRGKLYNCGVVIFDGEILGIVPKTYVPNYNEFYEIRHFASGKDIVSEYVQIKGKTIPFGVDLLFKNINDSRFIVGIEICEDLWVSIPPSSYLTQAGASVIVNLSASNEVIGKSEYRKELVKNQSARCDCAYIYASAGDGESTQDLVFSGHNIICEEGIVVSESKPFENLNIYADIDLEKIAHERQRKNTFEISNKKFREINFGMIEKSIIPSYSYSRFPFVPQDEEKRIERCEQILTMQAYGLKKRIEHINCKKIVVGLSGGLDSALAILVAVKAIDLSHRDRKDIIAVTMPCFGTTKRTKSNAEILALSLKTSFMDIDISKAVKQHFEDINQDMECFDVTFENGQARERTQVLMDIANKEGGIVLGTGDLSELALGWATYNGDHMSMYAVNASIPKTLVRYIVKYYADTCLNKETARALYDILDTPVSPELLPAKDGNISQKTEDLVGPYELHDYFLYLIVRWGFSPKKVFALALNTFKNIYKKEIVYKWLRNFYWRFFAQQFKRSCIPDGPKVGSVVLSPRGDWRMPSDAKVNLWLKEMEDIKETL